MTNERSQDYRQVLRGEWEARAAANPRYSLRAFARDLAVAPSRLSEILSGKQGLSRKVAARFADVMGFDEESKEHFCDLVSLEHGRSEEERRVAGIRLQKHRREDRFHQVKDDVFRAIADWHHFGILELAKVKGFRSDPKWIAKKLGVGEVQVAVAIERLLRMGLIKKKGRGWVPTHDHGSLEGGIPSASVRKFHSQVIDLAKQALLEKPFEKRSVVSHLLAIDQKDVPKARRELEKFESKFARTMEQTDSPDSLYCLSIQFFEITDS